MACAERAKRVEVLPNGNTGRTKLLKTVSEVISWYYRLFKKTKILVRGEKPAYFDKNRIPTQGEWVAYLKAK